MSDAFHAKRFIDCMMHRCKGGPGAVGSGRFEQGTRGRPDWLPTAQKMAFNEMFFRHGGRTPNWDLPRAEWSAEPIAV